MRIESNALAIEQVKPAKRGIAQSAGVLHDCVEDRLQVGGRATDHAQDLARRRLLFERLGQALLELTAPIEPSFFSDLRATAGLASSLAFAGFAPRRIGLSLPLTGVTTAQRSTTG